MDAILHYSDVTANVSKCVPLCLLISSAKIHIYPAPMSYIVDACMMRAATADHAGVLFCIFRSYTKATRVVTRNKENTVWPYFKTRLLVMKLWLRSN